MQIPDMLQKHRAGHNVALVTDEIFEHLKFARQQLDFAPARVTLRDTRSSVRSPTRSTRSLAAAVLRRASASTRANNSVKAKGLTR